MSSKHSFKKIRPNGTPPIHQKPPSEYLNLLPSTGRRVLRVNHACNSCRKLKIRCEGADNPPCANCKHNNVDCLFDRKDNIDDTDCRLRALESKIDSVRESQIQIQAMIQGIFDLLRQTSGRRFEGVKCTNFSDSSDSEPANDNPPKDSWKLALHNEHLSLSDAQKDLTSSLTSLHSDPNSTSQMTFDGDLLNAPSFGISDSLSSSIDNEALSLYSNLNSAHHPQTETMEASNNMYSLIAPNEQANIFSPRLDDFGRFWIPNETLDSFIIPAPVENKGLVDSVVSRSTSNQPLPSPDGFYMKWSTPTLDLSSQRFTKQNNLRDLLYDIDPPVWLLGDRNQENRDKTEVPNAITLELLDESEAVVLWNLYFTNYLSDPFIFDVRVDTFHSLKERSPTCFNCILMVASKIRDGANEPSYLQEQLCKAAVRGIQETMFRGVNSLESVQAMFIAATWLYPSGGPGWLATGHTIRLAVDLGLHRSISRLTERMNAGDLEPSDSNLLLMRAARVWLALYAFELQICVSTGRLPMTGGRETIRDIRLVFLHHPLAFPSDALLVSETELYTIVSEMILCMAASWRSKPLASDVLSEWQARIDAWHAEWEIILSTSPSLRLSSVLIRIGQHCSLNGIAHVYNDVSRSFAYLTVFGLHAYGIHSQKKTNEISTELKKDCIYAINAAKNILEISVNHIEYREHLRYAIPHARVVIAYVGTFLLRISRRLPSILDPVRATELAECLIDALSPSAPGAYLLQIKALIAENRKGMTHSFISSASRQSEVYSASNSSFNRFNFGANPAVAAMPSCFQHDQTARTEYFMPGPAIALSSVASYDGLTALFN